MLFWRQGSSVDQASTVSLHICISSARLAHHVFSVHRIECGNEDILNKHFTKRNVNTVDIITTAITTPLTSVSPPLQYHQHQSYQRSTITTVHVVLQPVLCGRQRVTGVTIAIPGILLYL